MYLGSTCWAGPSWVGDVASRRVLRELGVQVVSLTETFDAATPSGRLMLTLLSGIARSMDATKRLAEEGVWMGGIVACGFQVEARTPRPGLRGSTAIQESEPIQRAWRDARLIALHGALNLEGVSENHGRLMAGRLQQ